MEEQQRVEAEKKKTEQAQERPFLYCLNLVRNQKDETVRRGAVVRAIAICTRHQFMHIFKVFSFLFLFFYFKTKKKSTFLLPPPNK
jgi:hypothetical protein